jgi:DNA-binding LacI/PurR family transcriptional regulator
MKRSGGNFLWQEITNNVIDEIKTMKYHPGQKFYSISELSAHYGISDITSRRVLQELSQRGILKKIQGQGSFIRKKVRNFEILVVCMNNSASILETNQQIIMHRLFQGVNKCAVNAGIEIKIVSPLYLKYIKQPKYILVMYAPEILDDSFLEEIDKRKHICVCCHAPQALSGLSTVRPDLKAGIKLSTGYLLEKGHRRIAFLTGPIENKWFTPRFEAYYAQLKQYGINPDLKLVKETKSNDPEDDNSKIMEELLELPSPPTAIVAANDMRALQVLNYCSQNKIKIPEELAVVGYDNIDEGEIASPLLTSVKAHLSKQGEEAVTFLLEQYESNQRQIKDIVIAPELIVRESA